MLNHFRISCSHHDPSPQNNSVSSRNKKMLLHNPGIIFKFGEFNIYTKLLPNVLSISFSSYDNNVFFELLMCLCDPGPSPESCNALVYVSCVLSLL